MKASWNGRQAGRLLAGIARPLARRPRRPPVHEAEGGAGEVVRRNECDAARDAGLRRLHVAR